MTTKNSETSFNQKHDNNDYIIISKASIHNLKDISIKIPKNKLVVLTGPSGSGKSSLAFDTIYSEGQRRYIESLSSYARQFLEQFPPAEVDSIKGLSPTLAIDQKTINRNPRSTVGTITEIYDYLRIIYTRIGKTHCPKCKKKIERQSAEQIVTDLLNHPLGTKIQILAPLISLRKGEHKAELQKFATMGFTRIRIDGELFPLDENIEISKNKKHTIEIVIDRIVLKEGIRGRINDSVEQTLKIGKGSLIAIISDSSQVESQNKNKKVNKDNEKFYNEKSFCMNCNLYFPTLAPSSFSFNSPLGACTICDGLGYVKDFEESLIIQDFSLPISKGGIPLLTKKHSFLNRMIECIAENENVDLELPLKSLPKKFLQTLLYGSKKVYAFSFTSENSDFKFSKNFIGIHAWLKKKFLETNSEKVRDELQSYFKIQLCIGCNGQRLNENALSTRIYNLSIMDFCDLPIIKAFELLKFHFLSQANEEEKIIALKPIKEISDRLSFLLNVGLGYLTLNRSANSLAGGESQRIRLATQIGSSLSGVIYVLDEPSIGLHASDNEKLIQTLLSLKDIGNTVLVVEHDEETMKAADHIIDMGPGAGIHGGNVVAEGTLKDILRNPKSITGQFLSGKNEIPLPKETRIAKEYLLLNGAKKNNINNLELSIPLHVCVCITGVSGSGKSTLIHEILVPAILENIKYIMRKKNGNKSFEENKKLYENIKENRVSSTLYKTISNFESIQSIIELDQSPIGRTPKSNPATYTGVFDSIRTIFAETTESKMRGFKPGHFSFNVKGGRCDSCEGSGVKKIEMHFLPDVFITCHECEGKRYNKETLSILYKGKNIHDVLKMSIEESAHYFKHHHSIMKILQTLLDVGLGYMNLGQSATTLSGGEAQRLKLAAELSKPSRKHTLYILDEPTTGLHQSDVKILLKAIHRIVDNGHSVIIIEHDLDVIKTADYIIDLGPNGGDQGGKIVALGTPKEISNNNSSKTGSYLKKYFK